MKKAINSLPNFQPNETNISEEELIKITTKALKSLTMLHNKIEASNDKRIIATALFEQKKIFENLQKGAQKGYAHLGFATMKAMLITGLELNRFFDYSFPYPDNRGFEKIKNITKLSTYIPLMQKYNTIQKTNDITGFVLRLPNIKRMRFSPQLFDTLNTPSQTTQKSFNQECFEKIWDEIQPIKTSTEKHKLLRAQTVLHHAIKSGYPGASVPYIKLLTMQKKKSSAKILATLMVHHKYASPELKAEILGALNTQTNKTLQIKKQKISGRI